jgi:phosphoribosylglycinamide formyltransferase-1
MFRIAILASGAGTNAQRLIEHFKAVAAAEVVLVGCDRPRAGAAQIAWDRGVPCYLFNGAQLADGTLLRELNGLHVDMIVLAGFLRLLPLDLVRAYPDRILNIHPSLLPKHGGKGMFGERVHRSVLAAGDTESGITIHLVNERYDEGRILFQARCRVFPDDDDAKLRARVHGLEHAHYPVEVEKWMRTLTRDGRQDGV